MLLTIDIGNTSVHAGIFNGAKLVTQFREKTIKSSNTPRYDAFFATITQQAPLLEGIIIASVAPELDEEFTQLSKKNFQLEPLFISTRLKSNITNLSEKETPLGADRLADICAAIEHYSGDRVVVDLGTATKFEVIDAQNSYKGGAIGPGVQTSFDALIANASKLSHMTLQQPEKATGGFTTEEHLNSGFIYGFAGLVEGMIHRITTEQNWNTTTVILTGGYSALIGKNITIPTEINQDLTLHGLYLLWGMNHKGK